MTNYIAFSILKKSLKKAWVWIKRNWKFVSGVFVTLFVLAIFKKGPGLSVVLNRIKKDYEKELEIIENAHKKEIEDREAAFKIYKDSMDQIEKEYSQRREKLDKEKKRKIEKVILENSDNPDEITRRISEITGFKIHVS